MTKKQSKTSAQLDAKLSTLGHEMIVDCNYDHKTKKRIPVYGDVKNLFNEMGTKASALRTTLYECDGDMWMPFTLSDYRDLLTMLHKIESIKQYYNDEEYWLPID
tara:strand:+ start:37059 stop:37373 length:315 start_codon:yes stop_codon:yes gene_type:complete